MKKITGFVILCFGIFSSAQMAPGKRSGGAFRPPSEVKRARVREFDAPQETLGIARPNSAFEPYRNYDLPPDFVDEPQNFYVEPEMPQETFDLTPPAVPVDEPKLSPELFLIQKELNFRNKLYDTYSALKEAIKKSNETRFGDAHALFRAAIDTEEAFFRYSNAFPDKVEYVKDLYPINKLLREVLEIEAEYKYVDEHGLDDDL